MKGFLSLFKKKPAMKRLPLWPLKARERIDLLRDLVSKGCWYPGFLAIAFLLMKKG